MSAFGRFSIFTTLATYFLIFVGGLVRVSGAGLGCPDWPKCFGRWIPPISINQLPPEIDAGTFNLTLAWIEYVNRLIGMTVGLLILTLAIWAILSYRNKIRILLPAITAAILTAYQGWQGSQIVASELEPVIVSAHMIIALIIAGLLIYLSLQAYYLSLSSTEKKTSYPRNATLWMGLLLVFTLIQIIIGTQFRQGIETIASRYPLFAPGEIILQLSGIKNGHSFFGIVIAALAIIIAFKLLARKNDPSPLIVQSAWTMAGLASIQVVVGLVLMYVGFPAVTQVLHMWIASLIFGVVLISFLTLNRERGRA